MPAVVPPAPVTWPGSKPEWYIYWALLQLGLQDGADFVYQSPQGGGRQEYGGAVLDFLLPDRALAINVQSTFWHFGSEEARVHDQLVRAMVEGWGIQVVFIDEEDALRDPVFYAKEALAGRDHSKMTGGK